MLLALETSDRLCAVSLANPASGEIIASSTIDIERGHAQHLIGIMEVVMGEAATGYRDITQLAVCVGPGSFTGIRVGLSAATGLSIALGVPVRGVTSLQALALAAVAQAAGRDILALVDAHRGDVYAQTFSSDGLPQEPARQISLDLARERLHAREFFGIGSGVAALNASFPDIELDVGSENGLPDVNYVARAALVEAMSVAPKPLYLRRPDAKPQDAYTAARALR